MDLLRYFHTSPWQVFRSRDHGVNLLRFASHCFQVPRTRMGSTGVVLSLQKNLVLVKGKTLASILYSCHGSMPPASLPHAAPRRRARSRFTYGTRWITDALPVIRPKSAPLADGTELFLIAGLAYNFGRFGWPLSFAWRFALYRAD